MHAFKYNNATNLHPLKLETSTFTRKKPKCLH